MINIDLSDRMKINATFYFGLKKVNHDIPRIVKLERMGTADDKIMTDLKYMIKKVDN